MANHTPARLLVNGLGREQVETVRFLPVLVLGSKVEVEHMANDGSHLIASIHSSSAPYLEHHLLAHEHSLEIVDGELSASRVVLSLGKDVGNAPRDRWLYCHH